jgi:hypothetical protein
VGDQSDMNVGEQVPGISDFFDRRLFSLSEIYHENTKIRRTRYGQVFVACEPQLTTPPAPKLHFAMTHAYKTYHTADSIVLPKDLPPLTQSLEHVVRSRRSVREFSGAPISLKDLSRMLELRACANWRVAYVSRDSQKAVQSLREKSCTKSCPPIGAASKLRLY